jgi:hypothetical protein
VAASPFEGGVPPPPQGEEEKKILILRRAARPVSKDDRTINRQDAIGAVARSPHVKMGAAAME